MQVDRYHCEMGETAIKLGLWSKPCRFYATQRKLKYAPVLGHDRLIYDLKNNYPKGEDFDGLNRANLRLFADRFSARELNDLEVRVAKPATIMFANQPFADIRGKFGVVQAHEISFEHAFDLPMTVASRAMEMVESADSSEVMDFSNRRDGDFYRARDVARYSYIGGFNYTSNFDASQLYSIKWIGTVAHYWQQAFETQVEAFRAWLDAHPEGTTLLLDTYGLEKGIKDLLEALDTEERIKAFKAFRIDSGDLSAGAIKVYEALLKNGFRTLSRTCVLTGDLDADSIKQHKLKLYNYNSEITVIFGVGTKLLSEVDKVAGVIYKMTEFNERATMKYAENKSTLAGHLQVYRGYSEKMGRYTQDIVSFDDDIDVYAQLKEGGADKVIRLLEPLDLNSEFGFTHNLKRALEIERAKFYDIESYQSIVSQKVLDLQESIKNANR